jgi:hydrogenase expression/formation protein HypC
MCLAIPVKVVEFRPDQMALVDVGGVRKEISLALVDDIQIGDYVILHVGCALQRLDPEEAEATLQLMTQAGMLPGKGGGTTEFPD